MKKAIFLLLLLPVLVFGQSGNKILDIPYKKFTLKNGLTLIVHEDHKAPIVAVNVWYHVGSKNEKPGKTGFAHLFEHLMFNGSENNNTDYFKVMEKIGSTDLNGTTNNDRTNYFQNVPVSALDIALFAESDRMGHLIGAIDQAKLDEQRGVVQNEKRQGENEPYSLAYDLMASNTYPKGHPYSWTVIGSMEDLEAASLADVHEWFKTYYGPNNATLVIAGDVNPDDIYERVNRYFGDIPPGPPITKFQTYTAKMNAPLRLIAEDRVPQSKIIKSWNVPEWGSKDHTYLDLLSDVMAVGKVSRLYKRLVYDDKIATEVYAYVDAREIGSQFVIEATVKPGGDLKAVEKAIDEELERLHKDGVTQQELDRVRNQFFANFTRQAERIGGFGGKSDLLAQFQVYYGDPSYYKVVHQRILDAKPSDLSAVAKSWIDDGQFVLEIHPYPELNANTEGVNRSAMPELGNPPTVKFPEFIKDKLSNGVEVIFAERKSVPLVSVYLSMNAGYSSDKAGKEGLASFTMNMLDEGTKTRNSLQISEELSALGSNMNTGANLDASFISFSSLNSNLDKTLEIFSDVLLHPTFPQSELDRLKKERLAGIQQEKVTPIQMALRVFPTMLYGKGHSYAVPFSGSGYENTVSAFTRNDLETHYNEWLKPGGAKLIIVGDISWNEMKPKLEKYLSSWKSGTPPKKNITDVPLKDKPVIYVMDRPGSQQSVVFAGNLAPAYAKTDNVAVEVMNAVIGGNFTSRINMNIREDKHWSYGAGSVIFDAAAQRPFLVYTFVQSDKTTETIKEIVRELEEYTSTRPITETELETNKLNQSLSLAGSWETNGAVLGSLSQLVRFNLPDDYYAKYSSRVNSLSIDEIKTAASQVIHTKGLSWIVVGDYAKVGESLKQTGYEIKMIDLDGKILE